MLLFLLLLGLVHQSKQFIVIYQDKNTNIDKYLDFFSTIDDIIVLKHNFNKNDLTKIIKNYDVRGYIYPGGKSNISDYNTPYWKYVNLTINTGIPIMAICSGFEHYLKAISPKIMLSLCYMYDMEFNNQLHNHKWCVKSLYKKYIPKKYKLKYYTYYYENYIEKFESNNTIGVIYHPEKIAYKSRNKWNEIFTSIDILYNYYQKLPKRKMKPKSLYKNNHMYIYKNNKNH